MSTLRERIEARRTRHSDHILWLAAELDTGTSARYICPICHGGQSKERTLSVSRTGTRVVKYKCHRASCNVGGTIFSGGQEGVPITAAKKKDPRIFDRPTEMLGLAQQTSLDLKFELDITTMNLIRWCPVENRYILPINSPKHTRRGVLARSLDGGQPKSLTYNETPDEPFIGWFIGTEKEWGVVIVEDWFSAAKVRQAGFTSVCLNGTHINMAMADEIAKVANGNRVILALDDGTLPLMLQYSRLFGSTIWPNLQLWQLTLDLKYEKQERIRDAGKSGKAFVGSGADKQEELRSGI